MLLRVELRVSSRSTYGRWAWIFVAYTIGVILWGAFVRASLSGDGCGDHWPLCNGEVVPTAPALKTVVELTHRVTSGLAWIAALAFVVASRRIFAQGHPARRGAAWGLFFMTTEALVGAGLVIFRMVADNPDHARGGVAIVHLCNTFLLLSALTLHARWASRPQPLRWRDRPQWAFGMGVGFVGLLLVGATGAVAALGDTLFPSSTLGEGMARDFDPTSHLFLRLRVLHPIVAIATALYLTALGGAMAAREGMLARYGAWVAALAIAQIALGLLNVALLAPVWLQLVHLAVADALWIALTLCALEALCTEAPASTELSSGANDPADSSSNAVWEDKADELADDAAQRTMSMS